MRQITEVPIYLEASTKDELIKKMLDNNIKDSAYYPYQIMKDGKKWVAWFFKDLKDRIKINGGA